MPSAARPKTIARFAWLVADETRADARLFSAVSTCVTCRRIAFDAPAALGDGDRRACHCRVDLGDADQRHRIVVYVLVGRR